MVSIKKEEEPKGKKFKDLFKMETPRSDKEQENINVISQSTPDFTETNLSFGTKKNQFKYPSPRNKLDGIMIDNQSPSMLQDRAQFESGAEEEFFDTKKG